jgi:hypothetical protein
MKIEKRFGKNFIGVKLYKCFRFKYYYGICYVCLRTMFEESGVLCQICGQGGISMVDELAITNEIWRKWHEAKLIPPMTWAELRKKVEDYAKAGVVALEDFITLLEQKVTVVRAPPGSKKEWILRHPSEGTVSEEELRRRQQETIERLRSMGPRQLPWSNSEPEAIVDIAELPTFSLALLSKVERVWETKKPEIFWEWLIEPTDKGVLVGLRGASRPHELFTPEVIQQLHMGRRKGYPRVSGFMSNLYFEGEESRAQARYILQKHGIYPEDGPDFSFIDVEDADYVLELLSAAGFDTSKILVERA